MTSKRRVISLIFVSKRKFTMVNRFFNVTGFSHFTMVNATLVCCVSNGGMIKAKFTIVKPSQKAWFIARLSKLCLFGWHLVMNLRSISWLSWICTTYMCFPSPSSAIFWLSVHAVDFCDFLNILCHVRQLFAQLSESNFHFSYSFEVQL